MMNEPRWLNKKEYPFRHHFLDVGGHNMHYIDEGEGDVLLFIHGTPSWSFEYRKIILGLSGSYRCIAIDHIGFGLSDKPENYDYSPEQHSRNFRTFMDAMNLRDVVLVLHDFGGPIGLHYALRDPRNIKKIILFNTWAWDPGKDINRVLLKSRLLAFLYKRFNFSPRFLLPASFGEKKASKQVVQHYCKPFGRSSERNGPLAFARALATDGKWFDNLWNSLPLIWDIPVLIIWGMRDRFITFRYLDKLVAAFKNTKVNKLYGTGHFPQEEEPDQVSSFIRSFIEEKAHVHQDDLKTA